MSKTIFVGNISYDITEEQLIEIFSQVGRVIAFRLVIDRESGRSRGYGFCEYEDYETASSAVRNLNGYEISNRNLRVSWSDNDSVKGGGQINTPMSSQIGQIGQSQMSTQMNTTTNNTNTNNTLTTTLTNTTATDKITQIIGSLTANQLFEIMSQMKALVQNNPDQARSVLHQAPQISYALFQALIIMKVITPATIQQVLQSSLVSQQSQQYQQYHQPPPTTTTTITHNTSGVKGIDLNALPIEQRNALEQIMQLTEAQIDALPRVQRQQVLLLRQQLLLNQ